MAAAARLTMICELRGSGPGAHQRAGALSLRREQVVIAPGVNVDYLGQHLVIGARL